MQTLYSLIFFKDDQPLSCRIVRMEISDLPQILAFQQEIYQNLPDKDILFPLPQEDWEYLMNHGFTLAVFPEESDRLAYLIGCLYPKREENLGLDVGLRDDELDQVGQLEIAMASPDFRGYHMHSRMCSVCVDLFKQDGRTRFILSTVSPRNLPSLKALQSAGLQPLVENAIYHGLKPLGRPGHIYIRAQLRKGGPEGPMIWITVEDDGAGIPAEKLAVLNETLAAGQADPDKGYGIFNVNERIKLYYGNTYGLMLESLPGQGTRATLNFPSWIVEEPDDEAGV